MSAKSEWNLRWKSGFWLIAMVLLLSSAWINTKGTGFRHVAHADAAGYYLWLPAVCIYSDPDFRFTDSVFSQSEFYARGSFSTTLVDVEGGDTMNKYPPGAAFTALPFFLPVHIVSLFTGSHKGYEMQYQIAWWLASVFSILAGVWFLLRLACHSGVSFVTALSICILLLFGTNLYHYASWDAGYSHAFTFGWMSLAFYSLRRAADGGGQYDLQTAAFAMAMLVMIRPFNLLLLPVVMLVAVPPAKIPAFILSDRKRVFTALLAFAIPICLLLASNYWQSGRFFVYSYGHETFIWNQPHLWEFWFGFKIGAFVYSPFFVCMILLSCLVFFRRKMYSVLLISLVGFTAISWVLSCWSTWTFGCTLGNRPLVDWYVIWAFPMLSIPLQYTRRRMAFILIPLGSIFLWYNQVLHYQFRNWILNWCDMDRDKYVDVFMRTDPAYRFYTYDDWDFTYVKKDSVIVVGSVANMISITQSQQEIFSFDSLEMKPGKNYRIKFTCDMMWPNGIGEDKMTVAVSAGSAYHGYLQKFVKKSVRKSGIWQPFSYEFQVQPSDSLVKVVFSIKDHDEKLLKIRNCRSQLISWQE